MSNDILSIKCRDEDPVIFSADPDIDGKKCGSGSGWKKNADPDPAKIFMQLIFSQSFRSSCETIQGPKQESCCNALKASAVGFYS